MPPARLYLKLTLFCLCLAGGLALARSPSKIDDSAYDHVPQLNSAQPGWYKESGSDTHLMLNNAFGIAFEGHRMSHHLGLVGVIAATSVIAGRVPNFLGYDTSSLAGTIATSIPFLLWPLWVSKQIWNSFKSPNYRVQRHPVYIPDNNFLAKRLRIYFEHSIASQSIEIRTTPLLSSENAFDKRDNSTALAKLNKGILSLGSDRIEITWEGRSSPVEIKIWRPGLRQTIVEVPEWGKFLSARLKTQSLPPMMSFFQPAGLSFLNGILTCLKNGEIGDNLCPVGNLMSETETHNHSLLRFKPNRNLKLSLLKGVQKDNRYLLPLPPCQSQEQCSMAMAWFTGLETNIQSSLLPETERPLYLFTQPTALLQIPTHPPVHIAPTMRRIPAWLVEVLSIAPYAAIGAGTDQLMMKGLGALGISPSSLAGGGGVGAVGFSLFRISGDKNNAYGKGINSGISNLVIDGKNHPGNKTGFSQDDHAAISSLLFDEQKILNTLSKNTPAKGKYTLSRGSSNTLRYTGNNCFQDAIFSYLAHSMTEQELQGILEGRYTNQTIPESLITDLHSTLNRAFTSHTEPVALRNQLQKILTDSLVSATNAACSVELQNFIDRASASHDQGATLNELATLAQTYNRRARPKNYMEESKDVRTSFVNLIRGMQSNPPSKKDITHLRSTFLKNAWDYSQTSTLGMELLPNGNRKFLQQQDAHEFFTYLNNMLGIDSNPNTHINLDYKSNLNFGTEIYSTVSHDGNWEPMVTLPLPGLNDFLEHGVNDMSGLIGFFQTAEILDKDNAYYVSTEDVRNSGSNVPEGVGTGRNCTGNRAVQIAHPNPSEIKHFSFQIKLYRYPVSGVRYKAKTLSRHLLAGPGRDKLEVKVQTPDGKIETIHMKLDAVVMHSGDTMQSGHYTTATIHPEHIVIHDDMKRQLVEVRPTEGSNTDLHGSLLSHMEDTGSDPYLLHYIRAE